MDRRLCAGLLLIAGTVGLAGCGQASSQIRAGPSRPIPWSTTSRRSPACHRLRGFPRADRGHRHGGGPGPGLRLPEGVNFQDGQDRDEGELLFQIDPRPFQAARDRAGRVLEQAEAHANRLNNEYRRARVLYEQGRSISREEFDRYSFDHLPRRSPHSTRARPISAWRSSTSSSRRSGFPICRAGRNRARRPAQPAHGRSGQPGQGRRDDDGHGRHPRSDLHLLRRPRAGLAEDHPADPAGESRTQEEVPIQIACPTRKQGTIPAPG